MHEHIAIDADLLDQPIDQCALLGPAGIGLAHRNHGNQQHSRLALEQAQINGEQFPVDGEQTYGGAVEQEILAIAPFCCGPGAGGFQLGLVLGAIEAFPFELLQQPREPDPLNLEQLLVVVDPRTSLAVVDPNSSPGDLCIVGVVEHGADCNQPAFRATDAARYPVAMVDNVFDDEAHRALARTILKSACAARKIEVTEVEFGSFQRDDAYSWLCYLVNPAVEGMIVDGLIGSLTEKSAADHLLRYGFKNIVRSSSKRIAINVHELETSSEATLELFDEDGEELLIPVWQQDLLVVRAKFTYRSA
jgi:hypothetical protein